MSELESDGPTSTSHQQQQEQQHEQAAPASPSTSTASSSDWAPRGQISPGLLNKNSYLMDLYTKKYQIIYA